MARTSARMMLEAELRQSERDVAGSIADARRGLLELERLVNDRSATVLSTACEPVRSVALALVAAQRLMTARLALLLLDHNENTGG